MEALLYSRDCKMRRKLLFSWTLDQSNFFIKYFFRSRNSKIDNFRSWKSYNLQSLKVDNCRNSKTGLFKKIRMLLFILCNLPQNHNHNYYLKINVLTNDNLLQ